MPAIDQHYLWAAGHGVMLLGAAYVLLQTVFFRSISPKIYRGAYTGALVSYAIVVVKSLGRPSLNPAFLRRAYVDENVQYMVLALYWWISKPINISIIPFATFSLFHTLTFLRTNILPKFVPAQPPAAAGQPATPPALMQNVSTKIQLWVKGNYDSAMRFVAYAELAILARAAFGAVTFRSSFIAPIFLAHFIRLRYDASPFSKQAVSHVARIIDNFAAQRGGPIQNGWQTIRRMIGQWAGNRMVPEQPVPGRPAAAGAGANGARR